MSCLVVWDSFAQSGCTFKALPSPINIHLTWQVHVSAYWFEVNYWPFSKLDVLSPPSLKGNMNHQAAAASTSFFHQFKSHFGSRVLLMYSCIFVWLLYLNQFNSLLIKIYQSINVSGLTTRYQVPLSFNTYSVPSHPYIYTHTQRKKLLYLALSQTVAFITVNIVVVFFAVCTISVRHCHVHCSLHILWVCDNKKEVIES